MWRYLLWLKAMVGLTIYTHLLFKCDHNEFSWSRRCNFYRNPHYTFIDIGATQVASDNGISDFFADIITGIFFFLVIGCEFFINYKIKFRPRKKKSALNTAEEVAA